MKLLDIYKFLDNLSPFSTQEKWDNSGVNIGSFDDEIENIYISLDVDMRLVSEVKPNSLVIVHHPLIFSGLKELDYSKYPANIIKVMIQKNISLIAMHTNFDKSHLNRFVFEDVLGFVANDNSDFCVTSNGEWSYDEIIDIVKTKLGLKHIRVVNPKDTIKSISITTGSGASLMDMVESDCFLTGDIKYHDAMKAKSQNLMMIDIGHYESERFFVDCMMGHLKLLPNLGIIPNSENPFTYHE